MKKKSREVLGLSLLMTSCLLFIWVRLGEAGKGIEIDKVV